MKKRIFILLIIFMGGCSYVLTPVKKGIEGSYVENTYGKGSKHVFGRASVHDFRKVMKGQMDMLNSNKELNEARKEREIALLKGMKYQDYQYYLYVINTRQPLTNEKIALKFSFKDSRGMSVYRKILFAPLRIQWEDKYSSGTYYQYLWMMCLTQTLQEYSKDQLPLSFTVTYPNGQSDVYHVTQ